MIKYFSFHINETHLILQIDRNIMIVGTWEINEKITNYLYHNDFPKYILEQVQIYREINATYNMFIALTVNKSKFHLLIKLLVNFF